jgi:hypothetical protein
MFALRGAFGLVGIRVFGEHGHTACHRQQGSTGDLGGVRRDMFDPSARARFTSTMADTTPHGARHRFPVDYCR